MGEGLLLPGQSGFNMSSNDHKRDGLKQGMMPSKYKNTFIRQKTIDEIKSRIPLNSNFSGEIMDCPNCYTDLWCIEFDRKYACVDMQCFKCSQVWYDVPFDSVAKWFQRKMWKDYKLYDPVTVTIWAYAYFWRPSYKRRIRVLNHDSNYKYSKNN